MPTLPLWVWKLLAGLLLMAGVAGTTWFAAAAHYGKETAALKAADAQVVADQKAEDAATLTRYAQASMEINDAVKAESADLAVANADLGMRLAGHGEAIRICTNDTVWAVVPVADGSGAGASQTAPAGAVGSTEPSIAIPAGQLRDDLKIGIDAIAAEQSLRQLLRAGGQAAP